MSRWRTFTIYSFCKTNFGKRFGCDNFIFFVYPWGWELKPDEDVLLHSFQSLTGWG